MIKKVIIILIRIYANFLGMDEPTVCVLDDCPSTDLHYVRFVDEKADPERFEKWAIACRIDMAKVCSNSEFCQPWLFPSRGRNNHNNHKKMTTLIFSIPESTEVVRVAFPAERL